MDDNQISHGFITPSRKVIENGIVIPEEASVKKDLLALLLCLGEEEEETEVDLYGNETPVEKPEYDIGKETLGKNVDAYQAAQVMAHITKISKNVFVQKAISRSLKTKGILEPENLPMAQEAFVAGFLNLALTNTLTNIDLIPDAAEIKTNGDRVKNFLIGSGISWIGTRGRFQIKKLEKEAENTENEAAANPMGSMGGEEEQGFAESPGKNNINAQAAAKTNQKVDEAKSLQNISPKIDKEEADTADVALGSELEQRQLELLTYKDFFAFINNFFLVESEIRAITVALMRNLMNTNFSEYLEHVSSNPWEDLYNVKSLLHNNSSRGKAKPKKSPSSLLESLAYEYLALLTLIAKDLSEMYIMNRYKVQKAMMEQEQQQQMAQEQEMQMEQQETSDLEKEKMAADVEKTRAEAESKKKEKKPTKKKTSK